MNDLRCFHMMQDRVIIERKNNIEVIQSVTLTKTGRKNNLFFV